MPVQVKPTTADDVREFFPEALPWRIKALTGRVGGQIKGIGGMAVLPDGTLAAFLEASEDDCRRYPITLHRAARRFLADARAQCVRKIMAKCDTGRVAAARWLERLGFERI